MKSIVAGMVLLFACLAASAKEPSCHVKQTAWITFSDSASPDMLSVAVDGDPCYKGVAVISITNKAGRVIYKRKQAFKPLTSTQWDDPELDKDAASFVDYTITKGLQGTSSSLPAWAEPEAFFDANSTSVKVSHEYYDRLRKENVPVFYHQTYYEGGRHLVYDREKKKTVVVLEGGE